MPGHTAHGYTPPEPPRTPEALDWRGVEPDARQGLVFSAAGVLAILAIGLSALSVIAAAYYGSGALCGLIADECRWWTT